MGLDGLNRLGNADRQNASGMQRLADGRGIGPEIARDGRDGQLGRPRDPGAGRLDFIHKGHHIAGGAWIPCWHAVRKDKARSRVRRDAGLATKLRRTIALAFDDGRDREIIGMDHFTVPQFLALGEPRGLLANMRMVAQRRRERLGDALALGIAQRRCLCQEMLSLLPQGSKGFAKVEECLFCVAHQSHKDLALPTALAAKTPHHLGQLLLERLGLPRETGGTAATRLRNVCDKGQHFFCALYRVVASVPR